MSQAHYPSVSTVPQVVEPKTTEVCSDATADGRPSHQVPVEQFEVKLIWPVFVQPVRKNDVEWLCPELDPKEPDFLNAWVKQILENSNGRWQEVTSSYPPLQGEDSGPAYAEFCYFHPFVRNFLFVNRGDVRAWWKQPGNQKENHRKAVADSRNRNLRVLKRVDLEGSTLDFVYDMKPDCDAQQTLTSSFDVKSCWLYLFDTQIALMELHLAYTASTSVNLEGIEQTPPDLNLRMVLKLQDIMRRVYSPYWSVYGTDNETVHDDVHVPREMILRKQGTGQPEPIVARFGNFRVPKTLISEAAAKDVCGLRGDVPFNLNVDQVAAVNSAIDQRTYVFEHREPFTTAVWQELLSPLTPVRLTQPNIPLAQNEFLLRYEHIQDDRCPLMSYIAVGEPVPDSAFGDTCGIRQISKGDWIRLAGIDDEGDSSRWPFSPSFYDGDPLKGYAYDRFWHSTGYKPAQNIHTTRWLCSAYSFSAVGRANDQFFFTDSHAGALCHFRQHYFALVMVALFHRASLLRYKHALSEHADALYGSSATNRHEGKRLFHEKTVRLQEELMRFRSLYWISEVSNQTQGQELFRMLRNHLNLDKLYDDICVDIDKASAVLRQDADDKRQEADNKRQEASWTLTLLGVAFFLFSVFFGPLNDRIKATPFGGLAGATALLLLVAGIIGAIARSSVCELIARIIRGFRATSDNDEDSASGWLSKHSDHPAFRVLPLMSFLLGAFGLIYCLNSPEKVECGVSSPESHGTPQETATLPAQDKVGTAATSTIPVATSDDQGPVDQPIPPAEPSSGLDTPAKPPGANEDTAPTTEPDPASAQPDVREPTPSVDSALSQDSTDASGSKPNPDASAPQNPKSGSEPPNQDNGAGGDNPANR